MMTEQEFRARIKDGRAWKEHLEEAFTDLFRSMGWHDAAASMFATFDGLVDDGYGEDGYGEEWHHIERPNVLDQAEALLTVKNG